jgi:hypothetical protein
MRTLIITAVFGAIIGILIGPIFQPFEGVIRNAAYPGCHILDFIESYSQSISYDEAKESFRESSETIIQFEEDLKLKAAKIAASKRSIIWFKKNYDRERNSCGSIEGGHSTEELIRKEEENSVQIERLKLLIEIENGKLPIFRKGYKKLVNELIQAVGRGLNIKSCSDLKITSKNWKNELTKLKDQNTALLELESKRVGVFSESRKTIGVTNIRLNASLPQVCRELLER